MDNVNKFLTFDKIILFSVTNGQKKKLLFFKMDKRQPWISLKWTRDISFLLTSSPLCACVEP